MLAGALCFVVFLSKLDKLCLFVPANTMQGFTIAVAVIISLNQVNFALGLPPLPRHPSFVQNVMENFAHAYLLEWQALAMFLAFFSAQLGLTMFAPRVFGVMIPWAVVMACTGIFLGYLSSIEGAMSYQIRTLDGRYPGLSLSLFSVPTFPASFFIPATFFSLCSSAASIAFVGILETLISAK